MKQACLCLTLSIFLTLIAACGGQTTTQEAGQGENTTSDPSQESTVDQENETDNAAYQVPGFPAFSPAPRQVELVEDRGDTLLVRHNMGETEVPKDPQRVYVNTNIEVPVALGFNVVGGWYGSWQPMPPAFEEATQDAEIVDWSEVPNYEFAASLEPDLIFHWDNSGDPEVYELLSEIAPTIRFEADPFVYWREATLDLATVFGLEETANRMLTEYDAIISAECERIRSVVGDDTIDLVTVYEDSFHLVGPVWEQAEEFYTPTAYAIWAYRDCQLLPGAEVEELVGVQGSAELSLETIAALESEHLFVMQSIGQNETLDDILVEPLWQTLPAVQNGNVYLIEQIGANGYYSGIYTLELAAEAITGASGEEIEANTGETVTACDEGLRLFEHELLVGEPVCVPEDPQRVAHIPPASFFYALDFKPVASSFLERETRHLPPAIADWFLTDIDEVDYGSPSLEQLAALDLDLIIHHVSRVEEVTEQLNTIAPTVLFAADYGSPDLLRDRLLFTAEVLGREAEATEQLEIYNQRVTELQMALQESLGDVSTIEVSMLRARDEQTFDLYPRNRPQAAILDTLGFGRPAAIDYDRAELAEQYGTDNFLRISKEQLEFADGDVLIIILSPSSGEGGVASEETLAEIIQDDPLWNALNAFEQDNVHFVSYPWLLSDNIIFAHAVLDGLADIFDVEISTPNPFSSS